MLFRNEWSKQVVSGFLTSAILICATLGVGQDLGLVFTLGGTKGPEVHPSWWAARGVLDPEKTPSNPSLVNVGQLKWITRQFHEELTSFMPAEANLFPLSSVEPTAPQAFEPLMPYDQNYSNWIAGNQSAATLGQVKNCAVKFYDFLYTISPAWLSDQLNRSGHPADGRKYPWTATNADDQNKAAANIGQLKSVFSLRLRESLDDDLLPDIFEHALIKFVPAFAGKTLNDITWNPGDPVISLKGTGTDGNPIFVPTGTIVPSLGGSGNGVLSPAALLAEHQPVGSVGGSFAVGGDGAANYTIPISIPKGTSGVEPQIALSYSSNGGNGALGVGFDLSGFQRITRGATSRTKEGFYDPVDFDQNDRFFFNGELLIATKNKAGGAAIAADYGKDGTVYQTESNSFARIISHGQIDSGPQYWTVETKAGLTIELGNCPSSCVSSAALAGKGVLVWNVNKVSDNVGNFYRVTYQLGDPNSSALDYRLATVQYTGNGTMTPYNEIHFQWKDRPDVSLGYIHGVAINNKKRLDKIEVRSHGTLLYSYELGYTEKLARRASHLTTLTKRLSSGATLPPTTFTWQAESPQFPASQEPPVNWQAGSPAEENVTVSQSSSGSVANGFLDMNGDGLVDRVAHKKGTELGIWVSLNTGTGFTSPEKWLEKRPDHPVPAVSVQPQQPQLQSFPLPVRSHPYPINNSWGDQQKLNWYDKERQFVREYQYIEYLNALHREAHNAAMTKYYHDLALYDLSVAARDSAVEGTQAQHFFEWKYKGSLICGFVDMNGDGLPDRLSSLNGADGGIWVALNNGSGLAEPVKWVEGPPANTQPQVPGVPTKPDLHFVSFPVRYHSIVKPAPIYGARRVITNSQERANWDAAESAYVTAISNYYVSQGHHYNAFAAAYSTYGANVTTYHSALAARNSADEWQWSQGYLEFYHEGSKVNGLVDMNGDGLPDRVVYFNHYGSDNSYGLWVSLNTGSGFSAANKWWSSVQAEDNYIEWSYQGNQVNGLFDLNGDGLPDRVAHYNYNNPSTHGLWVSLNTGSGFAAATKWWSSVHWENNFLEWNGNGSQVNGFIDLNGDGLLDRVAHHNYNGPDISSGLWVSLNTGSSFATATKWWSSTKGEDNFFEWTINEGDHKGSKLNGFADFNGDGLPDRVAHYNYNGPDNSYGLWVSLNTGSGFATASKWWSNAAAADNYIEPFYKGSKVNGLIDFNGDGLPDRVTHDNDNSATLGYGLWVSLNTGSGFSTTASKWWSSATPEDNFLEWNDGNQTVNGFLDLNSDGLVDRISQRSQYPSGGIGTWVSLNSGSGFSKASISNDIGDRITSIEDGLSAEILIEYKRGSFDSVDDSGRRVYTKPAYNSTEVASGIIGVNGAGYLVSRYAEQNGLGGYRWMRQYYGERKLDREKEEDLGFKWTESVDEQRGHGGITTYSQACPYHGLPLESVSYIPSGANKIITSRQSQSYDQHTPIAGIGGEIHFAFLKSSKTWDYAFEGPHVAQTIVWNSFQANELSLVEVTNSGFDNHGNLTSSTAVTSDGFTTVTSNQYDDPVTASKWVLGRLEATTVTKSGPAGYTPVTKSSSFTYYDSGTFMGMLKTEIAEPTKPGAVEKSYTYDTWGNKASTTIRALNGDQPPRTSYVKYDSTGRFPVEEWNDLNHKAVHYYDQKRSLHLGSTGANGLTTRYFYDPWGTRILTRGPDGTEGVEITRYATAADVPAGTGLNGTTQNIVFIRKTQSTGAPASTAYIDAQGRVLMSSAESFDGRLVFSRKDYDVYGRAYRESLPFFAGEAILWSTLEFDDADRPWKNTAPDTTFSTIAYDGFTTVTTNASNQTQTRILNAQGWLTSVEDNDGNIIDYTYTVDGKPKETTAPGSRAIVTDLDDFGQVTSMNDPNVGTSSSDYYAFGEVKKTTDAKNATTEFTYDILGRQKTRIVRDATTAIESTTTWTYDTAPGAGLGKVHTVEMRNGTGTLTYFSSVRYDSLGRATETTVTQRGETFRSSVTYDSIGRPRTETDAGGLTILHEYNARGFKVGIRDYLTGQLYWKPLEYDASGRLIREELGNGVINTDTYDQARGTLTHSESLKGTAFLQKMKYQWVAGSGNLEKREDLRAGLSESFLYDSLNRLETSQVTGRAALSYTYEANGNLKTKANVGTYSYTSAARPHAVTSIAATSGVTRTFDYDLNGAFTIERRNGQTYREVVWAAHQNVKEFKLTGGPRVLKHNGTELYAPGNTITSFDYDASFSRSQKITERDQLQREVTHYLGSYERIIYESRANANLSYTVQKTEHRHSIGGLALKTFTEQAGVTSEEIAYFLKDHLGSLTATVDAAGIVKERYSFDAWGSRRDATTWSNSSYDALTKITATNRGYTGHEMLDELGIVHMNGRLYDPEIGRVLSGDPVIQEPDNSQNYNRYSYVTNNPLSFTDPSGYFFKKLFNSAKKLVKKAANAVKSAFKKVTKWVKENWQTVVVIVVATVLISTGVGAGVGGSLFSSFYGATGLVLTPAAYTAGVAATTGAFVGAVTGGLSSALAGGDLSDILKGALVGGIQGGITAGLLHGWEPQVAGFDFETARHVAGHGVVGGSANYAMGGKFQDGFFSAAAGVIGSYSSFADWSIVSRTIKASVIGGTVAEIGGGKFANGAWTASFQHLLNAELKNIVKGVKEVTAHYFIKEGHLTLAHPDSEYSVVAQMESGAWTKDPATDYRNNPDFQHVKSPDGSNGPAGPIPEGVYRIKVRPNGLKYGEPAYHLVPITGNAITYNRGGPKGPFVIHTDTGIGCIVPGGTDLKDYNYLAHRFQYSKVTSFMSQFKPQGDHYGTLYVHRSL